jgi:hypothetical protein
MSVVIGIEALKDKFRAAKLKCGDLRGLKNKFELSEKLGIPALQTYYYASGGNGGERAELTADCYSEESDRTIHAYTMKGLVEDIRAESETYEVNLICLMWNKQRTDANRKTIDTFLYKNK